MSVIEDPSIKRRSAIWKVVLPVTFTLIEHAQCLQWSWNNGQMENLLVKTYAVVPTIVHWRGMEVAEIRNAWDSNLIVKYILGSTAAASLTRGLEKGIDADDP